MLPQAVTTVWRTELGTTLLNGFDSTTDLSAYFHCLRSYQSAATCLTAPSSSPVWPRLAGPLLLWKRLEVNDSVVTFNWDLLTDQEFIGPGGKVFGQYGNFLHRVPLSSRDVLPGAIQGEGLFLKLHGSLNWFRCGNRKCQANEAITFFADPQRCLDWNAGDEDATCWRCGSVMSLVVIPPLLRKPITDDPVIRSAWGLAKERLANASRVFVVGFLAAPTDFYASWLLRSTLGTRQDVSIEMLASKSQIPAMRRTITTMASSRSEWAPSSLGATALL